MTDMKLNKGVLTIALPGLTAVRIDTHNQVIAIDHTSGEMDGTGEFTVHDLRAGTYGDFHLLQPAERCNDDECAAGQHIAAAADPWADVFAERAHRRCPGCQATLPSNPREQFCGDCLTAASEAF